MHKLPSAKDLLALEAQAKIKGSGIDVENLIGSWKFMYVWKEGNSQKDFLSGLMLRSILARLDINRNQINKDYMPFLITNSVQVGLLMLKFSGFGELKGKQPLLPFFFEKLEVKFGPQTIYRRLIDPPIEQKRPFFALVGMQPSGEWLAARGRGGGLALWLKIR